MGLYGDDNFAAIADIKCTVKMKNLKNFVNLRQLTRSNPPSKRPILIHFLHFVNHLNNSPTRFN